MADTLPKFDRSFGALADQGYAACENCVPVRDNPYWRETDDMNNIDDWSDDAHAWWVGWSTAFDDTENGGRPE